MVRPLAAVMPFAEDAGDVASGLEGFGKGMLVQIHALLSGRNAVDSCPSVVAAGQEFSTRRRADGLDVKAIEVRSGLGDRIDVRGGELLVAVVRVITPAGIIRQQDDDVRLRRGGCSNGQPKCEEEAHGVSPCLEGRMIGGKAGKAELRTELMTALRTEWRAEWKRRWMNR